MKLTLKLRGPDRTLPCAFHLSGSAAALAVVAALGLPQAALAQAPYAKPELAVDAFVAAVSTADEAALTVVMGKNWRSLVGLGDADADNRYAFLEKASQKRALTIQDGRANVTVGNDPWVLPIPVVQGKDGKWRFDIEAGREEVTTRRIGANELAAMQAMLASVDAQREYALVDRNGDGILEYAQRLASSPGKRDGLIWSPSLGDESPLGESFVPPKPGEGYHGYRFRILTGQGPKAPGGARNYLIGGRMVAGFALLAWPVRYGDTGVMSFIVNSAGNVYERDLGPQTAKAVEAIKVFNPDEGWKPATP